MWHYEIAQNQHCSNDNNHNDDNVMRASVWFECFNGFYENQTCDIWDGKVIIRSEIYIEIYEKEWH